MGISENSGLRLKPMVGLGIHMIIVLPWHSIPVHQSFRQSEATHGVRQTTHYVAATRADRTGQRGGEKSK